MKKEEIEKLKVEKAATEAMLNKVLEEALKGAVFQGIRIPAVTDGDKARAWAKVLRVDVKVENEESILKTLKDIVNIWNYGIESMNGNRVVRWSLMGRVVEVHSSNGKLWDICLMGRFMDK